MGNRRSDDPTTRRESSPTQYGISFSWVRSLIRQARLAWRLLRDPRVSPVTKLIPPATLVYLLFPIDVVPDLALGLGQLDDAAVILLGVKIFIELCPPDVVQEHLRDLGAQVQQGESEEVIEGEYQVVDSDESS